jgi:hypothetical protein
MILLRELAQGRESVSTRTKDDVSDHGQVVVLSGRRHVLGIYRVCNGTITVTTRHGRKSAELGELPPDHLARTLVRELAENAPLDNCLIQT